MGSLSFTNIIIVGMGLIGGSILKSLKGTMNSSNVLGIDLRLEVVEKAYDLHLIKNRSNKVDKIKEDCLVIFSVPTLSLTKAFDLVESHLETDEVIFTDTLSSKSELLNFLKKKPELQKKFLMSHPIAGSEKSGFSNSIRSLFKNKLVVISDPFNSVEKDSLERVKNFWTGLGSKVTLLDSKSHDKIFAHTSHLPHVLTYSLMDYLYKNLQEKTFLYSGGSLEAYTRIASSDPIMWKDIMISNKEEVLKAIKGFNESLSFLTELIEKGDGPSIEKLLKSIKDTREGLLSKKN